MKWEGFAHKVMACVPPSADFLLIITLLLYRWATTWTSVIVPMQFWKSGQHRLRCLSVLGLWQGVVGKPRGFRTWIQCHKSISLGCQRPEWFSRLLQCCEAQLGPIASLVLQPGSCIKHNTGTEFLIFDKELYYYNTVNNGKLSKMKRLTNVRPGQDYL